MDLNELLEVVQQLIAADSPKAVRRIIQDHPELLTEETINQLRQLAFLERAAGE